METRRFLGALDWLLLTAFCFYTTPAMGDKDDGDQNPQNVDTDEPAETPRNRRDDNGPKSPEVSYRGSITNVSEYVGDNGTAGESLYGDDDDFWTFQNIFHLMANSRSFDSALRLDATLFHNPPQEVDAEEFYWGPGSGDYTLLNYHNDYRLERIYGTIKLDNLHITAGDFYVTFGRGMVLSLTKQDSMNLDNTLRGLRIEYALPRKIKVVVLGGVVNTLNIDPITHQVLRDDPLDRIIGGRLEWNIADNCNFGVHAVYMTPRFTKENQVKKDRMFIDQGTGIQTVNYGLSADIGLEDLNIHLEANGQVHDNYRPPENTEDIKGELGFAAFGEVSYDFSTVGLKAQTFYYHRWLMEGALRGSAADVTTAQPVTYHTRVTLEPTWVPQKSFGNSVGGKLTGDFFFKDSDTEMILDNIILKYNGGIVPQGQWLETDDTLIIHPMLTLRQKLADTGLRLTLGGGYLRELDLKDSKRAGSLWHTLLEAAMHIAGPHGVHLRGELRRHELRISEGGVPYWITLIKTGYDLSGRLSVSAIYEYSDQTEGIDAKIGNWVLPLKRRHYLQGKIVFFPPKPFNDFTFALVGGSQRGGKKCTGGGCRVYPNSVGIKLETIYRF